MGNSIQQFEGNARVYILMDDYLPSDAKLNPSKTLYQLTSFENVNSSISVDNGGSASITFNDKDNRFMRYYPFDYLNTREFGLQNIKFNEKNSDGQNQTISDIKLSNPQEIELFRQMLEYYGQKNSVYKSLKVLSESDLSITNKANKEADDFGGVLTPVLTPQNILVIHYLGRDGRWYSGFKGIITSVGYSHTAGQTPKIKISAKTPDRLLEYSYIVTGLSNIGDAVTSKQDALDNDNQKQSIAMTNRYSDKSSDEIVVDAMTTANRFFLDRKFRDGTNDYRYFKVRNIFGFGEDTGDTVLMNDGTHERPKQDGEFGYDVVSDIWTNKSWSYDEPVDLVNDIYCGKEMLYNGEPVNKGDEKDWLQVLISKDFIDESETKAKPFNNLIRQNIPLFTTDKMTVKDVINTVKKATYSLIYFDADGRMKMERPYFDTNLYDKFNETGQEISINKPKLPNILSGEPAPKDYDTKYIISKQDISYRSSDIEENESALVTRTEVNMKTDWLGEVDKTIQAVVLAGKSESSEKTIAKYGDRQLMLDAIVLPAFVFGEKSNEILSSYAYAMKLALSSQMKTISITLDQRPDIQLNRNMVFLDYGMCFLTRQITTSFSPKEGRLTNTIQGNYVRNMGYGLFNPYLKLLRKTPDGLAPYWEITDWELKKLKNPKNDETIGYEIKSDNSIIQNGQATYESVVNEINNVISNSNYSQKNSEGFNEDFVSCYCMRLNGDINKPDQIFFIWKENGVPVEPVVFLASAGQVKTKPKYSIGEFSKYAELSLGSYIYTLDINVPIEKKVNPKTEQALSCYDFDYELVSKVVSDKGITSFEYDGVKYSSKNINPIDVNGDAKPYHTLLSRIHVDKYYNGLNKTNSKGDINYDTAQINVLKSNNAEANQFLRVLDAIQRRSNKLQVYVDVANITKVKKVQNVSKIEGSNSNLPVWKKFFLWCYMFENSILTGEFKDFFKTVKNKNGTDGYALTKFPSEIKDSYYKFHQKTNNDYYGFYLFTQKMLGLDGAGNDVKIAWKKFLETPSNQDSFAQTYFTDVLQFQYNKYKKEFEYIINNLYVTDDNKLKETQSADVINDYPVGKNIHINTKAGILCIIHRTILDNANKFNSFSDIRNSDIPLKVLKEFYYLDLIRNALENHPKYVPDTLKGITDRFAITSSGAIKIRELWAILYYFGKPEENYWSGI